MYKRYEVISFNKRLIYIINTINSKVRLRLKKKL